MPSLGDAAEQQAPARRRSLSVQDAEETEKAPDETAGDADTADEADGADDDDEQGDATLMAAELKREPVHMLEVHPAPVHTHSDARRFEKTLCVCGMLYLSREN